MAGALAEVEGDLEASERIRFLANLAQREHTDAVAAERAAYHDFRVTHTICDADRAKGPPEVPAWDGAARVWSGPFSVGRRG